MEIGGVLLLFVGLALAIVFMGFKVVPQGSQWTVERFGRYTTTLKPGLNIIVPVMDRIGRKLGISEQTYYTWKKKYGGLGVPELRELKAIREENRRLKALVADLSIDKTILQEALRKKW